MPRTLTVQEVYSRYMTILQAIEEGEKSDCNSLLYSNIQHKTRLSDSKFLRGIQLLEQGKFVKRIVIDGKGYYVLRKWGEMMLELRDRKDFWAWLVALQAVYMVDGPRVVVDGGDTSNI